MTIHNTKPPASVLALGALSVIGPLAIFTVIYSATGAGYCLLIAIAILACSWLNVAKQRAKAGPSAHFQRAMDSAARHTNAIWDVCIDGTKAGEISDEALALLRMDAMRQKRLHVAQAFNYTAVVSRFLLWLVVGLAGLLLVVNPYSMPETVHYILHDARGTWVTAIVVFVVGLSAYLTLFGLFAAVHGYDFFYVNYFRRDIAGSIRLVCDIHVDGCVSLRHKGADIQIVLAD